MNFGYLVGTGIFAVLFIIAVIAQIKTQRFHPALYWLTIIATTTVGTTLADFADRSLGIGYSVLIQAHVLNAASWYWLRPALDARKMADIARTLNPSIEIVLRTHTDEESKLMRTEQLGTVFFGEEELARGMTQHILARFRLLRIGCNRAS